mgnify:CR=1 FL=1
MIGVKRFLEHTVFWIGYWLLISFSAGLYDLDFETTFLYKLSSLPLTILVTYLFVYRIIPLYFNKKIMQFALYGALVMVLGLLLMRLYLGYVQFPLFYEDSDWVFVFFNWYRIAADLTQLCALIGIISAFKYYRDFKRTKDVVEELSLEKKKAELSFLRAQIHPHFLFNTLNSIYYSVVKKSDQGPNLIIQLSDMLRFVLYECKDDFIEINKEITLINNYIGIEQSRFGDRLSVDFDIEGDRSAKIPPLICFSLIENAFKHGASESVDQVKIKISIRVGQNKLLLEVKNPVVKGSDSDLFGASEGIGLKNVTKHLDLIFEGKYVLKSEQIDNIYVCSLEIPLN